VGDGRLLLMRVYTTAAGGRKGSVSSRDVDHARRDVPAVALYDALARSPLDAMRRHSARFVPAPCGGGCALRLLRPFHLQEHADPHGRVSDDHAFMSGSGSGRPAASIIRPSRKEARPTHMLVSMAASRSRAQVPVGTCCSRDRAAHDVTLPAEISDPGESLLAGVAGSWSLSDGTVVYHLLRRRAK